MQLCSSTACGRWRLRQSSASAAIWCSRTFDTKLLHRLIFWYVIIRTQRPTFCQQPCYVVLGRYTETQKKYPICWKFDIDSQNRKIPLTDNQIPKYRKSVWFLSSSLYVSKRGAYWDRLCRDVVGWLVVTRVHCGQTVHPRPKVTIEH